MYKEEVRGNQLGYRTSFVLVLGVLYINNSLMFEELFSATFRGIATILLFAATFVANCLTSSGGWRVRIDRRTLNFYVLAVTCSLFSIIVNGLNFEFDVYALLLLTIALGISSILSRDMFYRVYVDVMTVIAACGAVCFLLYAVAPSLFSMFPVYSWHSGILMRNCYVCAIPISTQNYRNFGIFREPGMFSTFLVFALFIEMFFNKPDLKKVVILFLALLTTLSTNGYICAMLLLIAFFTTRDMKDNPYLKSNKRKIILALMVLLICGISFLVVNSQARQFLLSKFGEISVGENVDNSSSSGSGFARYRAVVYAAQAFFSDPLFGIGYTGWSEKFSGVVGTATPINWFGLRGIVYGVLMNCFYFKIGFSLDANKGGNLTKILLCVILLCNVFSQNMSSEIIMYLLILYQCKGNDRLKNEKIQEGIHEAN